MSIEVLETATPNDGSVWFKVKLARNTDVLSKELYTKEDLVNSNIEAVKEFIKWHSERLADQFLEKDDGQN